MQRREFLAASTAAALGLAASPSAHGQEKKSDRQLIELRVYHFKNPDKQQAFARLLGGVVAPALNRAGVSPVGAFRLNAADNPDLKLTADSTDLYLVLPHDSAQSVLSVGDRLRYDEQFLLGARDMLLAPRSDPAFDRFDTSLLRSFTGFPRVQVTTMSPDRLLQLRTYESHSTERAQKKIEMFNDAGEMAIFKKCGMNGVFFGQCVAGTRMPHLTYMLSFENPDAMAKGWNAFRNDPDWKRLSADEQYKDTVSNIVNLVLRPVEGSQI